MITVFRDSLVVHLDLLNNIKKGIMLPFFSERNFTQDNIINKRFYQHLDGLWVRYNKGKIAVAVWSSFPKNTTQFKKKIIQSDAFNGNFNATMNYFWLILCLHIMFFLADFFCIDNIFMVDLMGPLTILRRFKCPELILEIIWPP